MKRNLDTTGFNLKSSKNYNQLFLFCPKIVDHNKYFFFITYYTAVTHNKDSHFRKFATIDQRAISYFAYFGSRDYDRLLLVQKIQDKFEAIKNKSQEGSYFEILKVGN